MDCRYGSKKRAQCRGAARLAAGLTLGLATAGCVPWASVPTTSTSTPMPAVAPPVVEKEVKADKDLPRREPQASTCVALGDLHLRTAMDPHCPSRQRMNALDLARKCYQQAIKTDPEDKDAYRGLVRVYDQLKEDERMVATYEKAIKKWPKDASFRSEFGMAQARRKQWEPALAHLKEAGELDPENRSYQTTYAYTLARAGQWQESYQAFCKVSTPAEAHYNLARMLHHLGQNDASREHLELALAADPSLTPARQMLTKLPGSGVTQTSASETTPGAVPPASAPK
jgi:tetratricopeptide (TPR) repeat protein